MSDLKDLRNRWMRLNCVRLELFELCYEAEMGSFLEIVKKLKKKTAELRKDSRKLGGSKKSKEGEQADDAVYLDKNVDRILRDVQKKTAIRKSRYQKSPEEEKQDVRNQRKILRDKVSSHFPNLYVLAEKKAVKKVAKKKAVKKNAARSKKKK